MKRERVECMLYLNIYRKREGSRESELGSTENELGSRENKSRSRENKSRSRENELGSMENTDGSRENPAWKRGGESDFSFFGIHVISSKVLDPLCFFLQRSLFVSGSGDSIAAFVTLIW